MGSKNKATEVDVEIVNKVRCRFVPASVLEFARRARRDHAARSVLLTSAGARLFDADGNEIELNERSQVKLGPLLDDAPSGMRDSLPVLLRVGGFGCSCPCCRSKDVRPLGVWEVASPTGDLRDADAYECEACRCLFWIR